MDNQVSLRKYALVSATMSAFDPLYEQFDKSGHPCDWRGIPGQCGPVRLGSEQLFIGFGCFFSADGKAGGYYWEEKGFHHRCFLFALFSFLSGLVHNIQTFIVFRVLQGAGSAMIFGTNMAILTSVFPPQERGKALGINSAAVYLGLSLGPVLGGFLNYRFGWHSIFFFCTLLALIAFSSSCLNFRGMDWSRAGKIRRAWRRPLYAGVSLFYVRLVVLY